MHPRSTRLPTFLLVTLLGFMFSTGAMAVPAGACAIGEGRWGGGPPVDAQIWSGGGEDLLLVGAGAELVVFDIDTPASPVELSRVPIDHPVISVALSADGQMASVSDWKDNVTLVDISNRSAPTLRGSFAWAGIQQPTGMAFDGSYLLVAVRTIGLAVLDISDPDAPAFVANSDGSVSDFVFDVALRGDHAYLGQGDDGVQIVDVGDPNDPTVVGNVSAWTGAGQIDIVGDRAFVARGANGFGILDLTNPVSPTQLGGFDTSGFAYETALLPGDRLAVADGFNGTVVYDISTPGSISGDLGSFGAYHYRLAALDDRVFVVPSADQLPRVGLVDFQTPATPSEVAHIDFLGRSQAVSVGTDHVLVANGDGGLVMLDTSNPVQPMELGSLAIDARRVGHVNGVGVASASYDGNITVVDPQPAGPVTITSFNDGFLSNDLIGDGNRFYVAAGEFGGLRIYDMTTPSMPQFLGSYVPAGEIVWQVAVSGDFAYSGYVNDTDLLVVDVSNPAMPVSGGANHVLPGGAKDIAASGNHVYVGTDLHGVRILQNDGSGNLSEVADIDTSPATVTGVSVDGNLLYISAGEFSGLLVYDVTDPGNPQFVAQHNTAGEGIGVDASGGVIAMAEGDSGVSTFGCDPMASNQPPVAVGSIGDQTSDEGETIFPLSTNPNFNDPDGQALTFTATGLPPGLGITVGSGVIEGTLGFDAAGSYSVEVTATDPYALFATQSFNWTINDANAPPVVVSAIGDQVNDEGDTVNLDISIHFSEPDGQTLRFEAGNLPDGLSLDGNSGVISGSLPGDSSGSYIVLVLAFDPEDAVTSQTFNWTVNDTDPLLFRSGFE
ncbi:MAG: putative Ig domain-containing protein [Lysobacteraceae bacterium]